jgi:5-methylcytosine-specific restriction endonuclease McrA
MEKKICKGCGENHYLVNLTKQLCDNCNYFRLHGQTRQEREGKKHQEWLERGMAKQASKQSLKQPKVYTIKTATKKEANNLVKLVELKKKITLKAIQEDMYFCWGCGKGEEGLDKSHILSVKQRKDLELDEDNINLFCRKCHVIWESGDVEKMVGLDTIEKDLAYIGEKDSGKLSVLMGKVEDYVTKNQGTRLERAKYLLNRFLLS